MAKSNKTLQQAVEEALLVPRTSTFGAVVSQHPITLAWDWFNNDEVPNTDGELWADMQQGGVDDLPYIWIAHDQAKEARHHSGDRVNNIIKEITAPYTGEEMLIELTESNGKLLNLLSGVLDIKDIREMTDILKIVEIHGDTIFEWVEEYMIERETDGYRKISLGSFVNGIRYLIFFRLAGGEGNRTRVTFDMCQRLTTIRVGVSRGGWGATLDRGDASEDEAKAFRDMIRHGITEERIERLQAIDYIIEE